MDALDWDQLREQLDVLGHAVTQPLILRCGESDWNTLDQDLYGDVYFPFQC